MSGDKPWLSLIPIVALLMFLMWLTYRPIVIDGNQCFVMLWRVTCW